MGAHNSTLNISEMSAKAKVNQLSSVSSNIDCGVTQSNSIAVSQHCDGSAYADVSGIRQDNNGICETIATMNTVNDQSSQQALTQAIQQTAESAMKGINIASDNEAENRSHQSMSAETNMDNIVSQNCMADVFQMNSMYIGQNAQEDCNVRISNVNQDNKSKASTSCKLGSTNTQSASQTLTQTATQVATATMVGIDPGMYIIYMYLIYTLGGLGSSYVFSKFILPKVGKLSLFIFILIILAIGSYIIVTSWSHPGKPMEQLNIPFFFFPGEKNKYYEEMKIIGPGVDGPTSNNNIFTVKYSKVFPLTSSESAKSGNDLKNTMKTKGLMNDEYKKLDGYSDSNVDNIGKEDPNFVMPANGISQHGGRWPQPEDAVDFMEKTENKKKYYAFEIIKYGIKDDGNIITLDTPVTLFYTELNEIFWNYDKLKNSKCISNDTVCGISQSKFKAGERLGGIPCEDEQGIDQCTEEGDKKYFCGTGGVGCISCEYCKTNEDGYGGVNYPREGGGCTEKCHGITATKSLKEELDNCRVCLGKILQQSDKINNGKIIPDPSLIPNYSDYINSEIMSEIASASGLDIPLYGSIELKSGKFQQYLGKDSRNQDKWQNVRVGFSNDNFAGLSIQEDNLTINDNNNIIFNPSGSISNIAEEKCLLYPIKYETNPSSSGSCNLDFGRPKSIDMDSPQELRLSNGSWTPVVLDNESTCANDKNATCYNLDDNNKCIDQYQATCGNLVSWIMNESDSAFQPCTSGKKLDSLKTLKDVAGCKLAAYKGSDGSNVSLRDLWTQSCRANCCIEERAPLTTSEAQGPQVYCKYIPSGSIGKVDRLLPHEANVIGIRMYRDGTDMKADETSTADRVKNLHLWLSICIAVIILITVGFYFNFSGKESNEDEDEG